jgi:nitrite reductase/ring-hydroxylating ferredoxin subunit
MKTVFNQCPANRRGTGETAETRNGSDQAPLNRRRFVAITSGCLLCSLGGASRAFAYGPTPVDIGPLKDYAKDGISDKFADKNFFVVRHKGRLFTFTSTCPHKGNFLLLDSKNPNRIVCSGHDSAFNPEGIPGGGPVKRGLPRFEVSLSDKGHVLVNRNVEFLQKDWNDKRSYVAVK